ncbi:AraC family transcriptional regulator [Pedobacter sp. SYP-B3415]|uniref:helix-turn-helix domain-containing protein n=1 Tax=Pedobacter sp. SYP-B3415 TaxID=2496641 RepID=UPI00101DB48B|nr:AraC family transcriptional regulator [Pedobacter sp. SYP-B3415]
MRSVLTEPFDISCQTFNVWTKPTQYSTFFELIFVLSGRGLQCINQSKFAYMPGHMFLITPDDCHSFEIETQTTLFSIRFNNIYIRNGALATESISRLEYILQHANHQPGCILKNQTDKLLVSPIIDAIVREQETKDLHNQDVVRQLVNTLIVLVARNIAKFLPIDTGRVQEEKTLDILHYIQSNIYEPQKLKTEHLSKVFNISNAYLGRYFKKHANETMQQYITDYRIRLIEHRLKYSDRRINEIAGEFGFSDESHLNKFFKKQRGSSPKAFRKKLRSAVLQPIS